jgi:hypothetical protein
MKLHKGVVKGERTKHLQEIPGLSRKFQEIPGKVVNGWS